MPPPVPGRGAAPGNTRGGLPRSLHPINGPGTRLCPCGIATATPQTFTVASGPGCTDPARSSPPVIRGGCAPPTSPNPPGLSWRDIKRRNRSRFLTYTFPSRSPRPAHPAVPGRRDSSRLLPPSRRPPGRAASAHPAAKTAEINRLSPPFGTTAPRGALPLVLRRWCSTRIRRCAAGSTLLLWMSLRLLWMSLRPRSWCLLGAGPRGWPCRSGATSRSLPGSSARA